MGVSKNGAVVYNGKSYSNGWFGGTLILGTSIVHGAWWLTSSEAFYNSYPQLKKAEVGIVQWPLSVHWSFHYPSNLGFSAPAPPNHQPFQQRHRILFALLVLPAPFAPHPAVLPTPTSVMSWARKNRPCSMDKWRFDWEKHSSLPEKIYDF